MKGQKDDRGQSEHIYEVTSEGRVVMDLKKLFGTPAVRTLFDLAEIVKAQRERDGSK